MRILDRLEDTPAQTPTPRNQTHTLLVFTATPDSPTVENLRLLSVIGDQKTSPVPQPTSLELVVDQSL
jgi:hypothetical protein